MSQTLNQSSLDKKSQTHSSSGEDHRKLTESVGAFVAWAKHRSGRAIPARIKNKQLESDWMQRLDSLEDALKRFGYA